MSDGGSSENDAHWVKRAKAGSDAAFARLVDLHAQGVRSFLRRLVQSDDEADDVAQEAFLSAWQNLGRLKEPSKFRSWLYGIAWRKAKTRARSFARTRARDKAWEDSLERSIDSVSETRVALDQALAQLEEDPRICIALNLGAGLSHSEVASTLNMPLGTVKSHITRGRARLNELLNLDPTAEGDGA